MLYCLAACRLSHAAGLSIRRRAAGLAEMIEVEKATAGRMVDRMEKKGWVVRRADAADRRVNRLHLTAEADLIRAQLAQIADRNVDDALALLSARERDILRLIDGLRTRPAPA